MARMRSWIDQLTGSDTGTAGVGLRACGQVGSPVTAG